MAEQTIKPPTNQQSQHQAKYWLAIAASAALLLISLLCYLLLSSDDLRNRNIGGTDGKIGGEFSLMGLNGPVSLSDFRGKVVMLYFGFVNCSQVCPISMGIMKNSLGKLNPQEFAEIQPILISVDVDNDSVVSVDNYAKQYGETFIGLTGTVEQIDAVINEYGAFYSPTDLQQPDPTRAFRHTSRYYIIDKQGQLRDAMRHSSTANELSARLRTLI